MTNEPQYQPGQPPYPAYPTVYAVRPPTHPLAIVSLVSSIVAMVLVWVPWLPIVLGAAGVVCGHLAVSKIASSPIPRSGRGLAVSGFIVGYVAILCGAIGIAFLLLLTGALNDSFQSAP